MWGAEPGDKTLERVAAVDLDEQLSAAEAEDLLQGAEEAVCGAHPQYARCVAVKHYGDFAAGIVREIMFGPDATALVAPLVIHFRGGAATVPAAEDVPPDMARFSPTDRFPLGRRRAPRQHGRVRSPCGRRYVEAQGVTPLRGAGHSGERRLYRSLFLIVFGYCDASCTSHSSLRQINDVVGI